MQWFKTMTTNEYIRQVRAGRWAPFAGHLWQRNYWERVIRTDEEQSEIEEYIRLNPAQWQWDDENRAALRSVARRRRTWESPP